jgi:hypothetical protein
MAVPVRDEIELVGRGASIAPGSGFSRNPREIQTPSGNLVFRTSAIAAKKLLQPCPSSAALKPREFFYGSQIIPQARSRYHGHNVTEEEIGTGR